MKILILNSGYLSEGLSGGDKHVIDVAEHWACEHEVTFFMPDFAAFRLSPPINVKSYPAIKPTSVVQILATYLMRLFRALYFVRKTSADIVISSLGIFDLWPAVFHKRKYGSKVAVYIYHLAKPRQVGKGIKRFQYALFRMGQYFSVRLANRADVVFTCNDYVKQDLIDVGIHEHLIRVIYLSVNVEAVRNAVPNAKYQVLFVGRLVRAKGIYDLVEAIKDFPFTVGLIGEGEEREKIQALIRQYGLEHRIQLVGYLPDNGTLLYSYLKGCDFFLFPSYEEGYGIAIAEAIVAEKPVIAYELPHYKKAFNDSLLLSPCGEVAGLKKHIEALMNGDIKKAELLSKYRQIDFLSPARAAARDLKEIQLS